jgi:hypothetical protein
MELLDDSPSGYSLPGLSPSTSTLAGVLQTGSWFRREAIFT